MDNKAREQYLATQPVTPKPQRLEPEPQPTLGTVEITVIAVIASLAVYAVYHMIKDLVKKSSHTDKS